MTWMLIKLTHEEVLASVLGNPNAHTFTRTSYCLAPQSWKEMDTEEMVGRLEHVLLAGYAKRNHTLKNTDDPTPMELLTLDFEWVPESAFAARPWTSTFQGFRISEDGREWHIVHYREVNELFDRHLLGQPS